MIYWFKKYFIADERNDHSPHILRNLATRTIIAIAIFLEILTFLMPSFYNVNTSENIAAVLPAVLNILSNTERETKNIPTLTVSHLLTQAAQMKADDMAKNGYFAHISPDGKTPWYWLEQVGYRYEYAGENLAINFCDSQDVTKAWMSSSTHKANIVKKNYTQIGTAIATGIYKGKKTMFIVQDYANPLPTKIKKTELIKTTTELSSEITRNPTNVLGSETVLNQTQDNQIIQDPSATIIETPASCEILPVSPRNITNIILYSIILYVAFGIITITLFLYFILRRKYHHMNLIKNGLIILAVIGIIFCINFYLIRHNTFITQSLHYSNQSK